MGINAIVGQSGGPTCVINSSLAGVFSACRRHGVQKVFGMRHGVQGLLKASLSAIRASGENHRISSQSKSAVVWITRLIIASCSGWRNGSPVAFRR